MSSKLTADKRYWIKDNGNKGVEIHDLSKTYDRLIQSLPKMDNRKLSELCVSLNNVDNALNVLDSACSFSHIPNAATVDAMLESRRDDGPINQQALPVRTYGAFAPKH